MFSHFFDLQGWRESKHTPGIPEDTFRQTPIELFSGIISKDWHDSETGTTVPMMKQRLENYRISCCFVIFPDLLSPDHVAERNDRADGNSNVGVYQVGSEIMPSMP